MTVENGHLKIVREVAPQSATSSTVETSYQASTGTTTGSDEDVHIEFATPNPWSARATTLFVIASSTMLWALIIWASMVILL